MENVRAYEMKSTPNMDAKKKEEMSFEGQNVDVLICQRMYGKAKAVGVTEYVSCIKKGDIVTDEAGDYYIVVEDAFNISIYSKDARALLNALYEQGIIEDFFEVDSKFLRDNREDENE